MLTFRRLDIADVDWRYVDSFADRLVFQSKEWLAFVSQTQHGQPVVAEIRDGTDRVGFFTGLLHRRLGVRMLGSPARGFSTAFMGFNVLPGIARRDLLPALEEFAFKQLGCAHFELLDRSFTEEDARATRLSYDTYRSYESDLRLSEAELFARMSSACRRCVRRSEKLGVTIEEVHDTAFADEYHDQLLDVFAKQRLVPSYGVERVRALIAHLLPTGRLLLLRARAPDGASIGTLIVPAMNTTAFFWGNASYRWGQHFRPNEALHWYAMRYWKARGIAYYEWGGGGEYKSKYGGQRISAPWLYKSRLKIMERFRAGARRAFRTQQRFRGWLRSMGEPVSAPTATDDASEA